MYTERERERDRGRERERETYVYIYIYMCVGLALRGLVSERRGKMSLAGARAANPRSESLDMLRRTLAARATYPVCVVLAWLILSLIDSYCLALSWLGLAFLVGLAICNVRACTHTSLASISTPKSQRANHELWKVCRTYTNN